MIVIAVLFVTLILYLIGLAIVRGLAPVFWFISILFKFLCSFVGVVLVALLIFIIHLLS